MSQTVVIVLPTYNEAANLPRMLSVLLGDLKLPKALLKVLVVDDNSPDGSGQIVERLAQTEDNLYLLSGNKEGLGKAYQRGFQYALSNLDPDIVVMMDADFSHDPHAIPRLVAEINSGRDYVIGSRYAEGGAIPGDWPLRRIINSRVANFVAHTIGGLNSGIRDVSGGFKAIRADVLRHIKWDNIKTNGYAFQMHLLHEAISGGASVAEVPITFIDRREGDSKLHWRDIVEFLKVAYGLNPQSQVHQLVRFALVGASGIVVNLGMLELLASTTSVNINLASAVAIEISILTNFLLHQRFTFREPVSSLHTGAAGAVDDAQHTTSWLKRLVMFNSSSLAAAFVSLGVFAVLHGGLHVHYLLAQFGGIVVSFGLNYLFASRVVWRQRASS